MEYLISIFRKVFFNTIRHRVWREGKSFVYFEKQKDILAGRTEIIIWFYAAHMLRVK